VEVTAAEVFDFLAHQRGDRRVVRLADRESGCQRGRSRAVTPEDQPPVPTPRKL